MKKIAIITINDNNNYGNRLQNFALQEYLKKMDCEVTTLRNEKFLNHKGNIKYRGYLYCRLIKNKIKAIVRVSSKRRANFKRFNKNIVFSKYRISAYTKNLDRKFDYFIVGSDQVWKPKFLRMSYVDMLQFAPNHKRISYAASFGVSDISDENIEKLKYGVQNFKKISVREESGKKIVEKATGRKDVEVLIDPTMLLDKEEWDKVSKKPDVLEEGKYILNYFLGDISDTRKEKIEKIAKDNNYNIINILDPQSPFYDCGPSEFLYLEKHAELICTDSFHSSVFAIIYDIPFIIFDREEDGMNDMNSRIDTLISKFKLKNRKYDEINITKENIEHDYTEAYKILDEERKKSFNYFMEVFDVEESDYNGC